MNLPVPINVLSNMFSSSLSGKELTFIKEINDYLILFDAVGGENSHAELLKVGQVKIFYCIYTCTLYINYACYL